MKTLETGENIKLAEFGRQFSLFVSGADNVYLMNGSKVIAKVYDNMPLDLNLHLSNNIKNLELVCKNTGNLRPCSIAIFKGEELICKHTLNDLSVGVFTVGKFYFYGDQEWRYRALNQNASSEQVYTLTHHLDNTQKTQQESQLQGYIPGNMFVQVALNNPTSSYLSASLDTYRGNIELSKMQSQFLPVDLRNLYVGFGWKSLNTKAGIFTKLVANQSLDIDLDLALLTFNQGGFVEVVNGFNIRSGDNAIYHYGDKSESQGDSEMMSISFPSLNPNITHIAIVVSSAKQHKFNLLEQSTLNLKNQEGMLPLISYNLQNGEEKSSCLIGLLIKRSMGWEFQTIEDYSNATNPRDLKDLAFNWIKFIK